MKKILPILFTFLIIFIKSQLTINTNIKETNFFPGSEPSGMLLMNDKLIFSANTGSGFEPHQYNLLNNSAEMIQNINNSFSSSMLKNEFYKINNIAYYFATDNSNLQLWAKDLSTSVNSKVKDFNFYYSNTNGITAKVFNNKLYFVCNSKLFVSDGTSNGTIQITNASGIGNYLCDNNGFVFFFGYSNDYGREIWKTDGTIAGTSIVKDINPGNNSSITYNYDKMYKFNNKIVFVAADNSYNLGIWTTDGTEINTEKIHTLANNSIFYDFDYQNYDKLLFTINGDLWKTDGTSLGTVIIHNNIPTIKKLSYFKNKIFIDTNTNLFYVDQADQLNPLTNANGTIFQTISASNNGNYLALREYNNDASRIYFFDNSNILETNIKFTNDTKFIEYQNRLIFSGYVDSYVEHFVTYKNTELFSYNPATNISNIEKDLIYGNSGAPRNFTEINGDIYFQSKDGYYYQIYKLDTNNNIIKLSSNLNDDFINDTVDFNSLKVSGNFIYSHNNKLFRTNTTTQSTEEILLPTAEKIYGTYPASDSRIIIKTYNSTEGKMKIWGLENNSTNLNLLIENFINYMPSSSNVDTDFVKTSNGIYFKMINNSTTEIWKSDGTINNTIKISDIGSIYPFKSFLGSLDNKVYFANNISTSFPNSELRYIDVSNNQNILIQNNYKFIHGSSFITNNKLYFFTSSNNGYYTEMHSTDGTSQGSQLINTNYFTSEGSALKCGNYNYFTAYSGGNQTTGLFRTDGTVAGTNLVIDGYQSGLMGQNFSNLNCYNNEIYFLDTSRKIIKTNGNPGNFQELTFKINNQVVQPNDYLWIKALYIYNSKIYLSITQYNNHGEELFISDSINSLSIGTENNLIKSDNKLVIYPNPVTNEFNVKLNNEEKILKVLLYDVNGKIVSTHNNTLINVQNLPSGIYFLNVYTSTKNYGGKVIKK